MSQNHGVGESLWIPLINNSKHNSIKYLIQKDTIDIRVPGTDTPPSGEVILDFPFSLHFHLAKSQQQMISIQLTK